jgi:hypothetical protein
MLHVPLEAVLAGRRMSELDDLLERYRHQKETAEELARRFARIIEYLERAKAELPEGATGEHEAFVNAAKLMPEIEIKEPKRSRGTVPPSNIAATVRLILSEAKRPMKRGQLVAELERREIPLAGKDKNKNLGTILWRHSNEFVHLPKLGYWLRDVAIRDVYEPDQELPI